MTQQAQMNVRIVNSDAQLVVQIIAADDTLLALGNDNDAGLYLRSTALGANTALTSVLVGTPVTPIGPAANSLIITNITASGDVMIAVNKGGTSYMAFHADSSTGDTLIGVPTGQSFDVYIAGTKQIDYANAALAFQQATTISTTTGILTLASASTLNINSAVEQVVAGAEGYYRTTTYRNASGQSSYAGRFARGTEGTPLTVNSGDTVFRFSSNGHDGTGFIQLAAIDFVVDGTPGTNDMPGRIVFLVTADGASSFTERWRIDNVGNLTSLAAAPANVTVAGAIIAGGGIAMTDVLNAWIDDATHGNGTTSILIGNQTITTSSDMRLKRDIELSRLNALEALDRFRVVDFNWADSYVAHEAYNRRGRWTGLIAQEAIGVVPYIINASGGESCPHCLAGQTCSEHGEWFAQYEHLVPVLVKGFQEVNARLTRLERQLIAAGIGPEE